MAAMRKIGNWAGARKLTSSLGLEMEKARFLSLMRWGLKAEGLAKTHMSKQDLGWKPLKPETISRKIRKGYSENILIETSSYFQSITSWVDKKSATVFAGVKKVARNKDGEEIANIAAVHEYGSRSGSIPARPLWQPVFEETMEWHFKNNQPEFYFLKAMAKKYGLKR